MFNKMRSQATGTRLVLLHHCTVRFSVVMLCWVMYALLSLPMPAQATPAPLKTHEAWQRLDTLAPEFPLVWAGRYRELKSIAEDADNYSLHLPLQLQQLRTVSMAAQSAVVSLLLDMVPAHANVHESSYILELLKNWTWRLEPPLRRTISTASGLEHSLQVLAGIGSAVEEMRANTKKRPVREKASQDFYDLYALVHERVQQLHNQLDSVRSVTQGIYNQIEIATVATEKLLPEKWIAYYTTPLIVTSRAFLRLGENFITMCQNWTYDKSYPTSVAFALVFNTLVIFSLMLAHTFLVRTAQSASQMESHHTFTQSLCADFFALNTQHKLAFGVCVVVMRNSIVDTLPQFHEGIPFLFIQHLVMLLALALWMRTSPADPKILELALPVLVGQMLRERGMDLDKLTIKRSTYSS